MRGRELFVWYRVRREESEAARALIEAMQRSLRDAWPGLRTGWLVRDGGAVSTWMETYARDDVGDIGHVGRGGTRGPGAAGSVMTGIDAPLEAAIAVAAEALRPALDGERHVESFERQS